MDAEIFTRLAAPFYPQDIEWRAGATNADKTKAMALAYITSRAVMDRLDKVVGPENWRDEYAPGPDGGVICGLSLRIDMEWVTKWDGAENTEFEAIKGGLSDAFKRAGYKWGIGRYLYKLENAWVPCEMHGKTIVLKTHPPLPAWALPDEVVSGPHTVVASKPTEVGMTTAEREQQLLKELGFSPKPAGAPANIVSDVGKVAKGNGSNGNGVQPAASWNGKRRSWGTLQVDALLKAKLAANPADAVRMLNESGLPPDTTPEQILARFN